MTMEIDALYAGQPMLRNGLDPCNTCAEWLALHARMQAAVAEERERCAQICEKAAEDDMTGYGIADDCANRIRGA